MAAADRLGRRLTEPDVADLSLLYQLRHGPNGLLDRDVGVDPVLVVEVDVIDAKSPQRAVDRGANVLGRPVQRANRRHIA